MNIFTSTEDQEYFLRRYNKIILKWSEEADLKVVQNQLTSFLMRFLRTCGDEKNLIAKYFNFLEAVPLSILTDALSEGQFESKLWLREKLLEHLPQSKLGNTLLLGGWIGLLGPLLLQKNSLKIDQLFSIDKDPRCLEWADLLNTLWLEKQWQFKAITGDVNQYDYSHFRAQTSQRIDQELKQIDFEVKPVNTIINTSCEHFSLKSWLPTVSTDTLLILQSNNYSELEEHNFCHRNLEEFVDECKLSRITYQGEKQLERYRRFLVIGYK